ncbi:Uncharacterized MFS-type transporter, partial [Arthrobacter sp. DR-2P]
AGFRCSGHPSRRGHPPGAVPLGDRGDVCPGVPGRVRIPCRHHHHAPGQPRTRRRRTLCARVCRSAGNRRDRHGCRRKLVRQARAHSPALRISGVVRAGPADCRDRGVHARAGCGPAGAGAGRGSPDSRVVCAGGAHLSRQPAPQDLCRVLRRVGGAVPGRAVCGRNRGAGLQLALGVPGRGRPGHPRAGDDCARAEGTRAASRTGRGAGGCAAALGAGQTCLGNPGGARCPGAQPVTRAPDPRPSRRAGAPGRCRRRPCPAGRPPAGSAGHPHRPPRPAQRDPGTRARRGSVLRSRGLPALPADRAVRLFAHICRPYAYRRGAGLGRSVGSAGAPGRQAVPSPCGGHRRPDGPGGGDPRIGDHRAALAARRRHCRLDPRRRRHGTAVSAAECHDPGAVQQGKRGLQQLRHVHRGLPGRRTGPRNDGHRLRSVYDDDGILRRGLRPRRRARRRRGRRRAPGHRRQNPL